jgi:glyoxylate reductase
VLGPPVLVTRRIPTSVLDRLREHCDVDAHEAATELPRPELLRRAADRQGLVTVVTDRVDAELIDASPALKVIANIGVGYDNVDLRAAARRGVVVTNTPDVLTGAVADFTMGLILAVTRRIAEGDRLIRAGGWKGWALDFMLGTDLRGRQLGIIGFGRIGRAVAERASAFGMRAAYATRHTDRDAAPAPPPGTTAATGLALDELLHTSDVVSLHVPFTRQTRHLIDQRALARMRRSAFLVNTARGAVVDESALVWALREHVIAGAALDVFDREPEVPPALLGLDNVVLAPHLGSATRETRIAMCDLAARNVIAVLSGHLPLTPVAAP